MSAPTGIQPLLALCILTFLTGCCYRGNEIVIVLINTKIWGPLLQKGGGDPCTFINLVVSMLRLYDQFWKTRRDWLTVKLSDELSERNTKKINSSISGPLTTGNHVKRRSAKRILKPISFKHYHFSWGPTSVWIFAAIDCKIQLQ